MLGWKIIGILLVLLLATAFFYLSFFPPCGCNILGLCTECGAQLTPSQTYWRYEARPFAILECDVNKDGNATLVLENSEAGKTFTLIEINIGQVTKKSNISFAPGNPGLIKLSGLPTGAAGQTYEFHVNITYVDQAGNQHAQYGAKPLPCRYS